VLQYIASACLNILKFGLESCYRCEASCTSSNACGLVQYLYSHAFARDLRLDVAADLTIREHRNWVHLICLPRAGVAAQFHLLPLVYICTQVLYPMLVLRFRSSILVSSHRPFVICTPSNHCCTSMTRGL
jgi:hypothetical protein